MILYLDTSALVKLYITERHSQHVFNAIKQSEIIATHLLAYVESLSAFARLNREKKIADHQYEALKLAFIKDWENYLRVDCTQPLMERAASFADAFALRAYDSVHLAAADLLLKKTNQNITFACFDNKLNKAACILGFTLISLR